MAIVTTIKKNTPAVPAVSSVPTLEAELRAAFPERDAAIRALLVAAVAGEHAFILGPPGTGKSLLSRTMAGAFGSTYWEKLMTRFTTPEEVFGPVKLSALQQDRFARAMDGYLPSAEVVFLDEVWKANSAIANALLTALNERIVHDDGAAKRIPLLTCVAASNELPEGSELDAIYDRFLVRLVVDYISDDAAFVSMLTAAPPSVTARVDIRAEQATARTVTVSQPTIDALIALRTACRKAGIVVSDRRWRQCLNLVRAAAHIDGRAVTEPEDLEILESVLWRKPDERGTVGRIVQETISPDGARAVELLDSAREIGARIAGGGEGVAWLSQVAQAVADLKQLAARAAALTPGRKVVEAQATIAAVQQDVARAAAKAAGLTL